MPELRLARHPLLNPHQVVLCGVGAVGKSTMCMQASQVPEEKNALFSTHEKLLALEGSGSYLVVLKVLACAAGP